MTTNRKKQANWFARARKQQIWGVLCIAAVALLVLALLHTSTVGNERATRAKAANTIGLDQLVLPHAVELTHQAVLHCAGTGLFGKQLCQAQESRVYSVPSDRNAIEAAMTKTLTVHGWSSDDNANLPDGYFFHASQVKSSALTSANVVRLSYGDNAKQPLQSRVRMILLATVPTNDGQDVGNTAFSYTDPKLKQKFTDTIKRGDHLLFITSGTAYKTWL